MTHAELYAITAQGPAVIMVARDDMLALLARVERAEAGLAAAVAAEREACALIAAETDTGWMDARTFTAQKVAAAIRARGTT